MGWLGGLFVFLTGALFGCFIGIVTMCVIVVGGGHGKRD